MSWRMTGMELFSTTKRIKPCPPRGMITSMYWSSFSIAPTAARSVVATTLHAVLGQAGLGPGRRG